MAQSARTLLVKKGLRRQTLELASGETKMPDEEWIKTLVEGRRVKFTNQELLQDKAFITAQVEGNKVVYSVVLSNARTPLSREEVERHFEGELSKN